VNISDDTIAEVERLLGMGLSHRNVASKVGISRGSVGSISRGELSDRRCVHERLAIVPTMTGDVGRCPTCKRKVKLPCHACYVESLVKV
jgi:hypothetical protein